MGADLYIEGAIKSLHEELNPLFEDAVHARNKIEDKDSKEFKDASDKVHSIYNDMYPTDLYFRDSYNSSSLMWSLGISWWKDVIPMLDDESMLSTEKAQDLIKMIEDSEIKLTDEQEERSDLDSEYFENQKVGLIKFLKTAVENKSSIECSL
tara:strand:- start:463 stop:918 length:456 start_codon:yes stop_codon:yes gene_type:complete